MSVSPHPATASVPGNEVAGSISPTQSRIAASPTPFTKREPSSSLGPVSPRIINSIETAPPRNAYIRKVTPVVAPRPPSPPNDLLPNPASRENSERPIPRVRLTWNAQRRVQDAAASTGDGLSRTLPPNPGTVLPFGTGLKLRLRGIQKALHGDNADIDHSSPTVSRPSRKRRAREISTHREDDTDSEIEIFASVRREKKAAKLQAKQRSRQPQQWVPPTAAGPSSKRQKTSHLAQQDQEEVMEDDDHSSNDGTQQLSLMMPVMKRNARILDPTKREHAQLIANAPKIGVDYYDSDAEDEPGNPKDTSKPELFRNVKWGTRATDFDNDEFPKKPEFRQFVPGRFELLPDGTAADQKGKLIIKFTDKKNKKRIFTNPPPRDWNSQEAITSLNKRCVQQIRRNTDVRFRDVVQPYIAVERRWILHHLNGGKPRDGWKKFVDDFNERFDGRIILGSKEPRPTRTHSSLTKEVERFGAQYYQKGLVPPDAATKRKGKGKAQDKGKGRAA